MTTPTPDRLTEDRAAVRETFDRLVHEDVVLRWDGASRAVMVLDDAFAATPIAYLATRPEPGDLDALRAALERLDAIARVDPRNEVGEVEFTDALAQSFTALHPDVRPVWKPREVR